MIEFVITTGLRVRCRPEAILALTENVSEDGQSRWWLVYMVSGSNFAVTEEVADEIYNAVKLGAYGGDEWKTA